MAAKKNMTTEELKETVDTTIENGKKAAKRATKAAKEKATKAVEEIKDGVEQAKKTTRKKTVKGSVVLQWGGREFVSEDLLVKVKEIWVNELGKTASSFKEAKVYVKPEENTAYYVVNDEVSGSFTL